MLFPFKKKNKNKNWEGVIFSLSVYFGYQYSKDSFVFPSSIPGKFTVFFILSTS